MIVPALNAERWLGQQLEALARQSYAGEWELVVADNGSTDGTRSLARSRGGSVPHFRLIDASEVRGAAHARNRGAQESTGDALLFCDSDDVVCREWISALASALSDWPLATGPLESLAAARFRNADESEPRTDEPMDRPFWRVGSGGNMAVRRDLFEKLGGFDETLLAAEDIDFGIRAELTGAIAGYASRAVVLRREPEAAAAIWKKRLSYGRARARMQRRHPQTFPNGWVGPALRDAGWVLVRLPYVALPRRRPVLVRRAAMLCGNLAERLRRPS